MAGGMGALMLDEYGWESMFYVTGLLSSLWALVVWQCFLKGAQIYTFLLVFLWRSRLSTSCWYKFTKRCSVTLICTHIRP